MLLVRFLALMLAAAVLLGSPGYGAELVMYRRAGCPWCQAWDREIGPVYDKTEIGRRLPVRLVALEGERPPVSLSSWSRRGWSWGGSKAIRARTSFGGSWSVLRNNCHCRPRRIALWSGTTAASRFT
jgi:hypothetical protein